MSHHGAHDHGHEHHDHDHGHDQEHDHSDDIEPALQSLIWKQIEFEKIRTMNESEVDAGAKIVEKTWPQRLDPEPELVSDSDEQLLMFVPYVSPLHLYRYIYTYTSMKFRRRRQTPLAPDPHLRLSFCPTDPTSLRQQR